MLSLLSITALLATLYYGSFAVKFIRNYFIARKTGFKIICIPWDVSSPVWMVLSPLARDLFERHLPTWAWERVSFALNAHEMWTKRKSYCKLGDGSYMLVTCGPIEICSSDPEVVYELLRRPRDFNQQDISNLVLSFFGTNLVTSDGDQWAKQRKLVASIINERVSKVVFEESHRQAGFMADELATTDKGQRGVESIESLKKIAVNVLSRAGYGMPQEWNEQATKQNEDSDLQLDFVTCVKATIENLILSALSRSSLLLRVPTWVPAAPRLHLIGHALREFPIHARARIDEERAILSSPTTDHTQRNSILSQLVKNSDSASVSTNNKKSAGLTEQEILGNLWVFTAAGFDTTANALQFAIILLAAYPSLQEWLYEEVLSVLGPQAPATTGNEPPETPDYATIFPRALRTQAFMMEVLRLYPPILHNVKCNKTGTTQEIKTSKTTYRIPPGASVYPDFPGLQTNPQVWRNLNLPLDPRQGKSERGESEGKEVEETLQDAIEQTKDEYAFRPGRWIVNGEDGKQSLFKPPSGSFVAFSAGPRVCPGQKMAQVEFVGVVMTLLRRFRVEANRKVVDDVKGKREETDEEVRVRLVGICQDVLQQLTIVMRRMGEVDLRWVERT